MQTAATKPTNELTGNSEQPTTLKTVPHEKGWPLVGHTFTLLSKPIELGRRMKEKHGSVYALHAFGQVVYNFRSPEAIKQILMDKSKDFSSEKGWAPWLEKLFPRGLMLLDFAEHKAHRAIMQPAFKPEPMKHYCEVMNAEIPARIAQWGKEKDFKFYPAFKQLSLDLATKVFFGDLSDAQAKEVNTALTNMVMAAVAPVRIPLPFTLMRKGVKGRAYMSDFIQGEIESRRAGDAGDIFSHMCRATDDDGKGFTDQEIIDHMNFLWMAAHDTITSSVTTLVHELSRNSQWQDRLRTEVDELGQNEPGVPYDRLNDLPLVDFAFKEALRLHPPVPSFARYALNDVEIEGFHVPKGSQIGITATATHMDEDIWDDPETFDPMRFSIEGGVGKRHKFAWVPFSGGAHTCIGLHFAYMQAKLMMAHLLPRFQLDVPAGYKADFAILPLTKPKDGLPLTLKPLDLDD